MTLSKKWLALIPLLSLLAACSDAPSESVVEGLIESQYEQAGSMMDDAMANVGDDEIAAAISGMMPKLESVDDINCDAAGGENTYMCTADITQTIAGDSRTNRASFKVYQVNNEWVLGN